METDCFSGSIQFQNSAVKPKASNRVLIGNFCGFIQFFNYNNPFLIEIYLLLLKYSNFQGCEARKVRLFKDGELEELPLGPYTLPPRNINVILIIYLSNLKNRFRTRIANPELRITVSWQVISAPVYIRGSGRSMPPSSSNITRLPGK